MSAYSPDVARIRDDVAALSAMVRSSARAGEASSAAWLAERLRALGVNQVAVESYRYQRSYALAHGLHCAAGVAACWRGGLRGSAAAAAVLMSFEREVSGRSQWVRRLLPGGAGANVVARVPGAGRQRATLVLAAHHDAANTGLVWDPRVVALGAARHLRRRRVDPFMGPLELALALGAVGGLVRGAGRGLRLAGAAILALGVAVDADVGRGETVPGASDNATGVAVCLDLIRELRARPLDGVEVLLVFPGGEEAGMGGMAAFLDRHATELRTQATLVLGLDTLGAGSPIVCGGEGAMREQRYHDEDLWLVDEGAALAGEPAPARWRIGAWTDPVLAVHRGIPAISLLSMGPGYFPHYHHPSDVAAHVDWESVERCARVAGGVVRAFARRAAHS